MWQYVKLRSAQAVYAACSDCFSLLSMARGPVKDWNTVCSIYYWVTLPYNCSFTNLKYSSQFILRRFWDSPLTWPLVSFHFLCTSIPFVTARYCKLTEPNPSPLPYLFRWSSWLQHTTWPVREWIDDKVHTNELRNTSVLHVTQVSSKGKSSILTCQGVTQMKIMRFGAEGLIGWSYIRIRIYEEAELAYRINQ